MIVGGAVVALFMLLNVLQAETAEQIRLLGLDPFLVQSVPRAFERYTSFLIVAFISLLAFIGFETRKERYQSWSTRRLVTFCAILASFLCYLVLTRCLQFPLSVDDAYIDYRYVVHWALGTGFDYNPGERVMGFTSHVHLVVLTLLLSIFKTVDISWISQATNTTLAIGSYFLVFVLLRSITMKPNVALAGAAIYALFPYNFIEAIAGKEAIVVSSLMLVSLYFMYKRNVHLVAWCAALVLLTRPEGGLWLLFAIVWSWRIQGKSIWKYWIGPLALLGGAAAWLYTSFGTLVPHSLIGKSNMFYKPFPMMDMVLVLRRIADGAFVPEFNFFIERPWSDVIDFFRLYGGAVMLLALIKFVKQPVLRFYAWIAIAYFLLYSIANPYLFPWYFCWFSLVPPLMVPIFMDELLQFTHKNKPKSQKIVAAACCFYLVLVQFAEQPLRLMAGLPALSFYWNGAYQRLLIYKQASEYIAQQNGGRDLKAVLAAPEVGVIGYYYPGPILDLGGLISDNVIRYAPPPPELQKDTSLFAIIPKIIDEMNPDYIVTDASFCQTGLYKEKFFKEKYKEEKFYPLLLWSDGIYIYKRTTTSQASQGSEPTPTSRQEHRD